MLPNILVPGIIKVINDAHVYASNCILDDETGLDKTISEYFKSGEYKEIRAVILDYYINYLNDYLDRDKNQNVE